MGGRNHHELVRGSERLACLSLENADPFADPLLGHARPNLVDDPGRT